MNKNRNRDDFRFIFVTQDDPFYVMSFFEEFLGSYGRLGEVEGVVICSAMGKRRITRLMGQMYGFYGPVDFFRMGMRYASSKALARAPAALRGGRSLDLTQLCRAHEIRVVHTDEVNSPAFLHTLREINPDLIVSVAAPVIFKKAVIELPRYGCINIHNATLPKYRGMMPNFWQLYHGEKKVGITIHEINEGIDDGGILLQREVDVLPGETLDSVIRRTKKLGAHLMIEALEAIKAGNVRYMENASSEATYYSFPTREDVREFRRRGRRIV
ncbi:MAG: formyltransferase family protein [Nitrospirota bacterium]|jgi:methionyl-tRNA formyltransferase